MKVVVFDFGFGGDLLAERLKEEVPVVEVIRVIDWRNASYHGQTEHEIRALVEVAIKEYIGKVRAIILASYDATVAALKYLRLKYPGQIFVGASWPVLRAGQKRQIVVMTTDLVRRSRAFRRLRRRLDGDMAVQVCDNWLAMVDDGDITEQKIKSETNRTRRLRPKIVVLGCANLIDVKPMIEKVYAGAAVLDGQTSTIRKLCREIGIKAVIS